MADNYLEKQREQYEARKAAWLKKSKTQKKKVLKPSAPSQPLPSSAPSQPMNPTIETPLPDAQ